MKTAFRRAHLSTHPRVVIARLKQAWPLLVWGGAVAGAAYLYLQTGSLTSMTGAVVTAVEPVAPLQTGRLLSLEVALGQHVKQGDVLAVMDASLLDARLAIEEAQMIEAEQTVSGFEQGMMRLVLDASTERHQSQLDLQEARMAQEGRLAELTVLKHELARRESLLEKGLDEATGVAELRPRIVALEKEIELFPAAEAIGVERLRGAERQLEALRSSLEIDGDASLLDAIRERASTQRGVLRASLARRLLEKDTYVLKARRDGIVSRIFAMPGDVIGGGDPILRLVSETSNASFSMILRWKRCVVLLQTRISGLPFLRTVGHPRFGFAMIRAAKDQFPPPTQKHRLKR